MTARSSAPAVCLAGTQSAASASPGNRRAGRSPGCAHEGRDRKLASLAQIVGVRRHDQRLQGAGTEQGLDLLQKLLSGDGHARAGVLHIVAQLVGAVHRIDRNHDRVRAQDREIRDHELGAVLQVEQHAIALAHAAAALKVAGEASGVAIELGVADARAVEVDGNAVRMARGPFGEVRVDAHAPHLHLLGEAVRPVRVMSGEHQSA